MPTLRTMFIPVVHVKKAELICSSIVGRHVVMFDHHGRLDRIIFETDSIVDDGPLDFVHHMNIGAESYPATKPERERFAKVFG